MKAREIECTICKIKFVSNSPNVFTCGNQKCVSRRYYVTHREELIRKSRIWDKLNPEKKAKSSKKSCDKFRKNNPERFNKLMRENYQRNKTKHNCRTATLKIINGSYGYKQYGILKKQCKCGAINNLELHHDEYPVNATGIRKAIDEGKIYYKCIPCHGRRNKHDDQK